MTNQNFFEFASVLSTGAARVSPVGLDSPSDVVDTELQRNLLMGSYGTIDFPVRFEKRLGRTFGDVLDTRSAVLFLISDRLKSLLAEESFSGWKVFPVQVQDQAGVEVPGYHGLTVTGRSGPIYISPISVIEKRVVPNGPISKYFKGKFLDEWDGSDFFLPKNHFGIMVSGRAAELLDTSNVTNLRLRRAADVEIDEYTASLIMSKR